MLKERLIDFASKNGYTYKYKVTVRILSIYGTEDFGRRSVMSQILNELLKQYVVDLCKIYGSRLKSVILYGSYARGDFNPDSDIDIMILVDMTDDEIRKKGHALSDITFDYNFYNELEIMPIVKNQEHFYKWLRSYPFYNTIKKEGVELYAA